MKRNRKWKRMICLSLSLLLLTALLSGCGSGNSSSDTSAGTAEYKYGEIQIPGLDGSLCGAPIYVAYENGYFAEEGFDVELISADFETRKIGLNNGTIPIVNGDFQFFPSMEEGIEAKVVDGFHNGCIKLVVTPDSEIQTVTDLRGKKIGVDEIGGTPYQVASVWLESAGISALQEDGEVTFLPFSDGNLQMEALYNGDIDVAAIWDPFGAVAIKEGKARAVLDISTDSVFSDRYCCFLFASSKVLEENPEEIDALLRAYHKAQQWIRTNPEETVDLIIEGNYSQIEDRELAVELISSYEYPSAEERENNTHSAKDDVEFFADALNKIGYLDTPAAEFVEKHYEEGHPQQEE